VSEDGQRVYHLALRDTHTALGGRFGLSLGWSLPMDYGDVVAEHSAIRDGVALLDRSHRSRFLLSGTDALDVLRATVSGHVGELEEGRSMRSVVLDDGGRIRDLVLVARTGGISYIVTGEPTQRFETLSRLQRAVQADYDARVDDRTESTCLLGIAGPASEAFVREQLSDALPARLPSLHTAAFEFHGFRTLALRTSDTGEDGFELMLAPAVMQHLLESLRASGAGVAGHSAQEIARVEACVPAFAPDLERGLTPAQADLDVLLNVPGGESGVILAALLLETDEAPAPGTTVEGEHRPVGEVRSAVRSPRLDATLGLAVIDQDHALPGVRLTVAGVGAAVVGKPFLRRSKTP
jgi:aminomethyltransferase